MSILTARSLRSIPVLKDLEIDPEAIKQISGIDRIGNLTPKQVMVSELLTLMAWRLRRRVQLPSGDRRDEAVRVAEHMPEGLRSSLRLHVRSGICARQHLWIGFIPPETLELMQAVFGNDAHGKPILQVIGPEIIPLQTKSVYEALDERPGIAHGQDEKKMQAILETPHLPVAINPSAWCQAWSKGTDEQQHFLRMAFEGADSASVSTRNYEALKACGARVVPSSWLTRSLRSPKFWAYVVIFVYSSLRALPLMFVPHFHGSVALLWTMDIVTAVPYTWGIIAFVADRRRWVRYLGLFVTVVTFVAPYVYFWTHGKHYPPRVIVVVMTMIVGAIAYEVFNYLRDRTIAKKLSVPDRR